jgi:holo-[acyl-carrier protein] synthase
VEGEMRIRQGVDIVAVSRLRAVCERHGRFVEETFTENERLYCMSKRDPYPHLAGRFAAKEACLKALGRGLRGAGGMLGEIEVAREPSGRPSLRLSGRAGKLAGRLGVSGMTVSISHAGDLAVSTVILTGREAEG